jgi:RNA polymerase sigma-70 factor (ECF subfamily)
MATAPPMDDATLLLALKEGDEQAFLVLVDTWGPWMMRLARTHVATDAQAEEVVQEAWLGILRGLDKFAGRSSLKTWAYRIVSNIAKTKGIREGRSVPFSSVAPLDDDGPAVDPDRFRPLDDQYPNNWQTPPQRWPEQRLTDAETRDHALAAIVALPPRQREVITLRDIEGFSSEEACHALDISEANQRVLLHRARSKVRAALEHHFDAVQTA